LSGSPNSLIFNCPFGDNAIKSVAKLWRKYKSAYPGYDQEYTDQAITILLKVCHITAFLNFKECCHPNKHYLQAKWEFV
jgi:hypothetical protein